MPDISPTNTPSNALTWDNVSNVMPMTDNPNQIASESQVYKGDLAVAGLIGKVFPATGIAYGAFAMPRKATTNSSGVATIYLTDNNLSTGNAVFTTVYEDGIVCMPTGGTNNYQVTSVVLSSDKKYLTVSVNQLGSVVLGLVNVTSAAAGIDVRAIVLGK